jgi:ATP-binding cassette, subfamily B, bacterial MsbA
MISIRKSFNRAVDLGLPYSHIAFLVLLSLLSTIMEVFGIGIFLPIFQFIKHKGDINVLMSESDIWPYIIDLFSRLGIEASLEPLLLASFGFFLARQSLEYTNMIFRSKITQGFVCNLRKKMFQNYLFSDISYHNRIPVGNFINTVTTEVMRSVIGAMTPINLLVYIIMTIGYLSFLLFISWQLTLASIIVIFIGILIIKFWINKSKSIGRKIVSANTLLSDFLVGRLKFPRLIMLSNTELHEIAEFDKLAYIQKEYEIGKAILRAKADVSLEPLLVGMSLLFIYTSFAIFNMQIETIGLYLLIVMRLSPVTKQIVSQWQRLNSVLGSIEIVEKRLREMKNNKEVNSGLIEIKKFQFKISFDNVTYQYPSSNSSALDKISTCIKKGEITALVGPSGSGKSTFIDMIPQLRRASSGVVLIDNYSIKDYTLKSLRKLISYVPQQPEIFSRTIKDHIKYGNIKSTDAEVKEAANIANIAEFIESLNDGYDTLLGEDAIVLSGGQKQRLDLARAIIKNTPILILDEPTSNLDAKSEELFKKALLNIKKQKDITIIVIAHRLSSIVDSDKIIILKGGKIEIEGKHKDLLSSSLWYKEAWDLQNSGSLIKH